MTDSIIMERVADAAADCFYHELVKTEDFQAFEALVSADMRAGDGAAARRAGRLALVHGKAAEGGRIDGGEEGEADAGDLGQRLGAADPPAYVGEERGDIALPQNLGSCYHRGTEATTLSSRIAPGSQRSQNGPFPDKLNSHCHDLLDAAPAPCGYNKRGSSICPAYN